MYIIYAIVIFLIIIITIWHKPCVCVGQQKNINSLTRQMLRWYIASTQDNEVIIKNLHSNYAMGYLSALRNIATDDEIYQSTGLDVQKISKAIAAQQDASLIKFAQECPDLIPDDDVYRDYIKKFLPEIT